MRNAQKKGSIQNPKIAVRILAEFTPQIARSVFELEAERTSSYAQTTLLDYCKITQSMKTDKNARTAHIDSIRSKFPSMERLLNGPPEVYEVFRCIAEKVNGRAMLLATPEESKNRNFTRRMNCIFSKFNCGKGSGDCQYVPDLSQFNLIERIFSLFGVGDNGAAGKIGLKDEVFMEKKKDFRYFLVNGGASLYRIDRELMIGKSKDYFRHFALGHVQLGWPSEHQPTAQQEAKLKDVRLRHRKTTEAPASSSLLQPSTTTSLRAKEAANAPCSSSQSRTHSHKPTTSASASATEVSGKSVGRIPSLRTPVRSKDPATATSPLRRTLSVAVLCVMCPGISKELLFTIFYQ